MRLLETRTRRPGRLSQRHERQRNTKTDFHDVVHPNHPYDVFWQSKHL
jgi:hypothetical protein